MRQEGITRVKRWWLASDTKDKKTVGDYLQKLEEGTPVWG